ncbi:MAG: solute carrier family 23 protein [Bacilli bacterium]|nr:solute carrier family 23 protein [Bacilli bacterium]
MDEQKNLVLDVDENPSRVRDYFLFAIQHILAMLVACITVPFLTGLPVAATLVAAGIGTLCYIIFTKKKSPVFLSSSFAYLSPMSSALAIGLINNAGGNNYLALILGMILVGLIYVIVALVIKFVGTNWLGKLLPPIVVGPVIMVIGLGLAGSAVSNITVASGSNQSYNLIALLCGLIALFATALSAHYGKKMIALIPFIVGMLSGYLAAVLFTLIGFYGCGNDYFNIVDFSALVNIFSEGNISFASFFNYKLFVPNDPESFIFLRFDEISKFDWATIGEVCLLFAPVAFVTICEHVGDHENLGNILNRDLLNGEPGMKNTLLGDGVATALSGVLCGAANTTYGENVAVIGMTKIASIRVIILAAIMTILFGFFTPFTALLQTIPFCVTGGVSLILYGFIASSGVKMLVKEKVDFSNTKNIFVASVILVAGIGGLTLTFGDVNNPVIKITSIAVSMILGIVLNFILKDKKVEKKSTIDLDK